MKLRVAGAQISVNNNCINDNFHTIDRALDFAIREQADILLTPEGSLSGYHNQFNQNKLEQALQELVSKASRSRVGLALGTCFYEDALCYNQIRFYDENGHYLGSHTKTLTCSTLTDPPQGEIEYFSVKPLRTFNINGITIGGLICNDMWANPGCTTMPDPHLSQQLSRMGAKIIFHSVNGGRDASEFTQVVVRNYHESNLLMRAKAANAWIVTVDNAFPEHIPNSCSGGVISPMGEWTKKVATQREQFFAHTIEV